MASSFHQAPQNQSQPQAGSDSEAAASQDRSAQPASAASQPAPRRPVLFRDYASI
ncbi:hypothetical protein [Pseudoroseicyclus aestuarii]|uniref:Uncharacterized protein n=1 Tax=Pseudoroseicyclus aestuarii TaxID=1795041 RepID=A0A318SSC8_9RHOB|nr:hypothetical protein [Pseudoroseicyclus aestuarii]PYE81276.1 hypothetical protein DFP88_10766 [Pseudoroseicyclus aestuarii]